MKGERRMRKQRGLSVQRGRLSGSGDTVARDLGWFSVGLGFAELIEPHAVGRLIGMPRSGPVLGLYGLREIATGIGILAARDPAPWVWARVGGDALDAATLLPGLLGRRRGRTLLALLTVAGVTALDVLCAQTLESRRARRVSRFDYSDRAGIRRPGTATRTGPKDTGPTEARPYQQA
jgi:hypothetical protein